MAAKHYVGAAGRRTGYYARTGAVRSVTATRRGVAEIVSTLRVAVSQGAHRAARVLVGDLTALTGGDPISLPKPIDPPETDFCPRA